jgi:cytoskeletal protein RodZ
MKDHELEKLMRRITRDAALNDAAADDIADSQTLWWSVQREIRNAELVRAPWPPNFLQRLLMIGVPVVAAVLIGVGLYVNSVRTVPPETASQVKKDVRQTTSASAGLMVQTSPSVVQPQTEPLSVPAIQKGNSTVKPVHAMQRTHTISLPRTLVAKSSSSTATEIKSEFIALAYARSPESGQLIRVKVPSSMMVSLGVVPTVNDPSKLIDAEVLVGDDGLTHAIRFIRQ